MGVDTRVERMAGAQRANGRTNGNDQDMRMIIDDVFEGLLHHWVLILVLVSLCATLGYMYGKKTYVPKYQTSVSFVVDTSSALNYGSDYYNRATAAQIATTFPYIIKNEAMQAIIAKDLGMSSVPGTITATAMEDTNLITVRVEAYDPQVAYDIQQSVLSNYPQVARSVIGDTELSIMDASGVPTSPMNWSQERHYAIYGCMAALIYSFAMLAAGSYFKKTIRTEDDFRRLLNIKCFGSVPMVRFKQSRKASNRVLITNHRVGYGFIESIRTLRTRVERDHLENNAQVYMISSALAGEGKSTVAVNLAMALASKGKKVLLVDMDLRNSSVLKTINAPNMQNITYGYADVLRGTKTLEEVMLTEEETGLIVIPGGNAKNDAIQLLTSKRMEGLFSIFRNLAEYVIVDTPPSSLLSDAASLVRFADAGIFVVRQDYAPVERVVDGIEILVDTGLRMCGCVLNQAESGITGYMYGYGYGYGSRYGYGNKYGGYGKYGKYGNQSKYSKVSSDDEEEDE